MDAPEDERQQIARSRNGDQEAFAALVRAHQRMIHSLTFRMTGSLADAEDLAQETFIRAFQQLDSFRAEAKFSTWLCRIAVNACLNWRQREGRRNEVHERWAAEALASDVLPSADGHGNDGLATVQAALNRLPAKQRAALVLTVYEGLNHAEAARVLSCSETTVSWRLFAARNKLRKFLRPLVTRT
jgi:RNA polymerase sigma-70 factor, ECF subfamily